MCRDNAERLWALFIWLRKPVRIFRQMYTGEREYHFFSENIPRWWTVPFEFSPEFPKIPVKWIAPFFDQ